MNGRFEFEGDRKSRRNALIIMIIIMVAPKRIWRVVEKGVPETILTRLLSTFSSSVLVLFFTDSLFNSFPTHRAGGW